jgi:hypothetical protein
MRKTSDYHGFQVQIHCYNGTDSLLNKGKVYRTHAAAQKAVAALVDKLDAGTVTIDCFSYCTIVDWFAA